MDPLLDAWAGAWRPHDRRPIYEWAREHVILPNAYAVTGAFHVEKSRYLMAPFDAILDDQVRTVTVQAGVQTGKSLLADVTACWIICNRPHSFYWNFPTDEQANDYAQRRVMPLLENTPLIRARLDAIHRHKKKKNEIHFGNMWMAIQGANEGNLQSHSVATIINDELWDWKPGMHIHALARTTYFEWRKKVINISQGGRKGTDIDQQYAAGTMEEWEVPCPECRHYQPLVWNTMTGQRTHDGKPIYAGVVWDINDITRPGGRWQFDRLKETVRYRCVKCLAEFADEPRVRRQLNDYGRFRVTNPNASHDHRSFHWPSMACDEVRWATLAEEYLRGKDQERIGNRLPIEEFWLKRPAVTFDADAHTTFELLPTADIKTSGGKPKWELQDFIFMTVDVQRDHFWGLVHAWSKHGQDLVLWAGRLETWQDVADKQADYLVPDRCVFVDARHRTQEVYRECTLHGHAAPRGSGQEWICWTAMMGDHRREFVYVPKDGPDEGKRMRLPYSWPPTYADPCLGMQEDAPSRKSLTGKYCPVLLFAKGTIDPLSFDRRERMLRGEISLVAPGEWNREFAKQMQGEQPETLRSPLGFTKTTSKRTGPNHLLDCYRMSLVAACIAKIITPSSQI